MRGHHRGRRSCGIGDNPRRFNREHWLERLEEHQKDLEQEIADLADLIRRLKDEKPAEPSTI